jgi:hypothetical protein
MSDTKPDADQERSEFFDALKKGALLGVAILVIVVPPIRMAKKAQAPPPPVVALAPPASPAPRAAPPHAPNNGHPPVAQAPAAPPADAPAVADAAPPAPKGVQLADFRGEQPSAEALHVANWAVYTHDFKKHAFVIVDKGDARVYVFGPDGKLKDSAPALLGAWHGDDSAPGIGDKPLSQVKPSEKTTPAGRFVAEPGKNSHGEDIVWVSYDLAVSMHRVRPLVAAEHRLERLATRSIDDNRISFGCINLPVTFYENVLSPTVHKYGAIVYVLPEVKSPQKVFGSFDVPPLQQVALRTPRRG